MSIDKKNDIPGFILAAVQLLLEPYGVNLTKLLQQQEPTRGMKPIEKAWLSTEEAMHYTGLSRSTLSRAAKAHKVNARKMSSSQQGKLLYEKASIDAWLKDYPVKTNGENVE